MIRARRELGNGFFLEFVNTKSALEMTQFDSWLTCDPRWLACRHFTLLMLGECLTLCVRLIVRKMLPL